MSAEPARTSCSSTAAGRRRDLEGEMRRIAAHLGTTVPEAARRELVEAATFSRVKQRADMFAPGGLLKDYLLEWLLRRR
ncbi:hypothetical protein [Micromonospora sp. NPDC005367]|uniref:hypothetical protein n=1 Tax=Micromonospora sp. NPDC005367 TaxID=3155590 RepID=UPI0033A73C20